nr:lytic transglycosylase domain-containing protein [Saprospiraceae bacterium]
MKMLTALVCPFLISIGISSLAHKAEAKEKPVGDHFVEFSEDRASVYLNELNLSIDAMPGAVFHRQVKSYLVQGSEYSNRLLARIAMYFPYIDEQLEQRGLPPELKYLTITESGVNPLARSRAGAVGLWQIMSGTARYLGLRIGSAVDERRDPIASTDAALDYLEAMYAKFGNWELALAAYNCGPGRVDQAIRRANSRDFNAVKRFLPIETRQYVPSFLAAVYFGSFHHLHGVNVEIVDYDLVLTSSMRVYESTGLSELADKTGLDIAVIRKLNPSILRNYIPASSKGYNIILPTWAIQLLEVQPMVEENKEVHHSEIQFKRVFSNYVTSIYEVEDYAKWSQLGDRLYVNPYQLKYLNSHINYDLVPPGKQVKFVFPRFSGQVMAAVNEKEMVIMVGEVNPLESRPIAKIESPFNSGFPILPSSVLQATDAHHSSNRLRKMVNVRNVQGRGQSLSDVKRMESFQGQRSTEWKAAFAGETVH